MEEEGIREREISECTAEMASHQFSARREKQKKDGEEKNHQGKGGEGCDQTEDLKCPSTIHIAKNTEVQTSF